MGPFALRDLVENAELYPIKGLFNLKDYATEIDHALNELYDVVPGELTIVTGVPNSGTSEWIDALLCNLNQSVGWKFALCSMENKVREHARKLLEKHIRKPFFDVREMEVIAEYTQSVQRMNVEELEQGKQWRLSDTFSLIRLLQILNCVGCFPYMMLILQKSNQFFLCFLDICWLHFLTQTETEYVRQVLTKIKRFAQHHSCHVWFVAHPRQLHNWVGRPPNLYDISGIAHFINKCDNGIVIQRNRDPEAGPVDLVQFTKDIKFFNFSSLLRCVYKRVTGECMDLDQ
ncbi:twinkle homolog, chloroplastic mitochondrial [Olea europaea subsp. europaea]|uniref:Twinkle homolog, chloroplastic mitochondrial n=1 Tax=Olea europaea subsp. europaea TaxID=158383 RepID=A0A8S0RZ17_OLEEU|nr:twinkle homolog, chloroplastic mitochondrial [Olea europaea subsp. europaea]